MKQLCEVTFQHSTGAGADGWEVEYLGRTVAPRELASLCHMTALRRAGQTWCIHLGAVRDKASLPYGVKGVSGSNLCASKHPSPFLHTWGVEEGVRNSAAEAVSASWVLTGLTPPHDSPGMALSSPLLLLLRFHESGKKQTEQRHTQRCS